MSLKQKHLAEQSIEQGVPGESPVFDIPGFRRDNPRGYTLIDEQVEQEYFGLVEGWDNRAVKLHTSTEQTPTSTEDGLGLHFDKISLYHGGATPGIMSFEPAEDTTIGEGFYATSMPDQAFGYALARSKHRKLSGGEIFQDDQSPTVYEVELSDAKFIDLRVRDENYDAVMLRFADYLETWRNAQTPEATQSAHSQIYNRIVLEKIDMIRNAKPGEMPVGKLLLMQTGHQFSEFVTGLGYDGIIATEGGEGGYTGVHDSWVIMEPSKLEKTDEVSFNHPLVYDQDGAKASAVFQNVPIPTP